MRSLRSLSVAVLVTVVAVVGMYVLVTVGISSWSQSRAEGGGIVALPDTVEGVPPSVGTTAQYGPLGPVSLVFPGTEVEDGLVGTVERPWLAVGARSGDYRAISAPDLPPAERGAVAVDRAGERLAWATGDGVVVYDATTDESRRVALAGADAVGAFSPDSSMLAVHAGGLAVLDLASGEVVAEAPDADAEAVRRSAWHSDGSAVDYVSGSDLVSVPADGGEPRSQRSPVEAGAPMAWAPDGSRLVAFRDDSQGVPRLVSVPADGRGRLGRPEVVDTSGISLHGLLGFSGDRTVAVTAFLLETGSTQRVLDVPLDGGSAASVTTLPRPGENWRGFATLAAAGDALRSGSTDFGNQPWAWSYRARLVACVLVGIFGLGLWLTRRRRVGRGRR